MKRSSERTREEESRIRQRIGGVIHAEREARGLTLKALGELAEIDVSQLSRVERGRGATSLGTYARIAQELGLSLQELMERASLGDGHGGESKRQGGRSSARRRSPSRFARHPSDHDHAPAVARGNR